MRLSWRVAALLLLLLLAAQTAAQSGDGDTDSEPRISCTSHIAMKESSVTCELIGGHSEDDEDDNEDDCIERMIMCYRDFAVNKIRCLNGSGDTITSKHLQPLAQFNLTVHLRKGGTITTPIDLKKIVKPRSPHVWNVTLNQETNQAVFHIRTPYHNDYLKINNQRFQLHIWTDNSEITQDVFQKDTLAISMEHLQKNRKYHVKVRAKPSEHLQGSWSDWGQTYSFSSPAGENAEWETIYKLIVCLVPLVVLTFSVVFFWKNKIFTYMWPNIPHPKHTLVQICKPNKGLMLHIKPEVFSALKISPMERASCEETEPSLPAAADRSNAPSSSQSSDCSRDNASISTEELELLSRSSSDGEDSVQSSGPSPVDVPRFAERPHTPAPERSAGQNEPEVFAVSQQEEAYVTMSSFYQIN
ncbi:interleukin-7 receptor subunit alpha-like [Scomber scombrus]|uniref:Interleukin-7 receptor subunit alpha-like n=1 Tax=Scomber scombrus TaxID=13677 RepID=A0AAV1QCH1_SCOSC